MLRVAAGVLGILLLTIAIIALPQHVVKSARAQLMTGTTLPSQPAPAAAAGFATNVYASTFPNLSSIDLNATNANGYKWYTKQFTGSHIAPVTNPTPASVFSIVNGKLKMATNPNTALGGFELQSVGYLGGNAVTAGYQMDGSKGGYIEVSASFDPAGAYGNADARPWPGPLWLMDLAGILALVNGTSLAHSCEIDIFEALPTGVGTIRPAMTVHDWTMVNTTDTDNSNTANNIVSLGTPTYTNFNKYGFLWLTQAQNGGTGLFRRYFNGAVVAGADVTYSSTGPSNHSAPSNPNGVYSICESVSLVMFLQAGFNNWALNVEYVTIWQ